MKRILLFVAILALLVYSCEKDPGIEPGLIDNESETSFADDVIPGVYIVQLDGAISSLKSTLADETARKALVSEEASRILQRTGVDGKSPNRIYGSAFKGFSVSLSEEEASALKKQEGVKGVWEDRIVTLKKPGTVPTDPPAQSVPYGITRVGSITYTGSHVAWIIDTGIDLDHPDLNVDALKSKTFVIRTTSPEDDNGHGSHCAGIVAAIDNEIGVVGVAAGATVVAVKVLNRRGSGTMTDIIAGVDYVAANAQPGDVANLSLGGSVYDPIDEAVINLGASGVFVALAAGNESDDANNHSPARANGTNLYTVSAMDINDNFAYFSNYGNPPIDYCAPGVSVLSTYKSGGYATMSGTSMAAPHVCGLLLATGGNLSSDGYVNSDPDGEPDPIAHN
ncbi:MAG: S8 family serine peptidase [Bacteroidales bacterium]|nr:S8 family serine peptidase [Bacteroidales bacterium]